MPGVAGDNDRPVVVGVTQLGERLPDPRGERPPLPQARVAGGLPPKLKDRKAAARRVLEAHQEWSDRKVAEAAGLSPKTLAAIRAASPCSTEATPQLTTRVGRDNRRRAMPKTGRGIAARHSGAVSPSTIDPMSWALAPDPGPRLRLERRSRARGPAAALAAQDLDPAVAMTALRDDPSIRLSDSGRDLLRLLLSSGISNSEWRRIAKAVPAYRRNLVAELAEQCAASWHAFARSLRELTELDKQARESGQALIRGQQTTKATMNERRQRDETRIHPLRLSEVDGNGAQR